MKFSQQSVVPALGCSGGVIPVLISCVVMLAVMQMKLSSVSPLMLSQGLFEIYVELSIFFSIGNLQICSYSESLYPKHYK